MAISQQKLDDGHLFKVLVSLNAVTVIDYFNNAEAAKAFQSYIRRCKNPAYNPATPANAINSNSSLKSRTPWTQRTEKHSYTVKSLDLPVGVFDRVLKTSYKLSNGTKTDYCYNAIVLEFEAPCGKRKSFTRAYGEKRTRAQAVELVTASCKAYIKKVSTNKGFDGVC